MTLWRLVLREIHHRRLSFLLATVSVAIAIDCLVGALTMLHTDELHTLEILECRQAEVEQAGAKLKDTMCWITIGLGFNVQVLAQDEDLADLHFMGVPTKTFPEDFVRWLSDSDIVTVNHLLPIVSKRVDWLEMQ